MLLFILFWESVMPQSTSASQPGTPIKYTVPFTSAVNAALLRAAAAQRMEPTEIIQRATTNSLIEDGFIEKADADRIKLFWALVDRAVTAAQNICRANRFKSSITLDAIHDCMKDPAKLNGQPYNWTDGYRAYVQDDIYKNGNPEKGPINREIGFRIRAGIGGLVEKGDDGKSKTTKVLGEIIQSYTPMADFDQETFKPQASSAFKAGSPAVRE
jgi:hypothetical protein